MLTHSRDSGCSVKNIPLPQKESHIYKLIDKTEQLFKRNKICFTMKSRKCPPQVESVKGFERDLTKMIEKIQFRKAFSAFLLKLDGEIKTIQSSKKMFVSADKTQTSTKSKRKTMRKYFMKI